MQTTPAQPTGIPQHDMLPSGDDPVHIYEFCKARGCEALFDGVFIHCVTQRQKAKARAVPDEQDDPSYKQLLIAAQATIKTAKSQEAQRVRPRLVVLFSVLVHCYIAECMVLSDSRLRSMTSRTSLFRFRYSRLTEKRIAYLIEQRMPTPRDCQTLDKLDEDVTLND